MSKIYHRLCTKIFVIEGLKKRRQPLEEKPYVRVCCSVSVLKKLQTTSLKFERMKEFLLHDLK